MNRKNVWTTENELPKIEYIEQSKGWTGWICPRCGRVNAPWVSCCVCSVNESPTWKIPQPISC